MRYSLTKNLYFASLVVLLSACGGGGGSTSEDGPAALTGQFVDSPVSGIRYETATQSGVTDGNGQFEYMEGETVSLYIGDQLLGEASGAETITLFDLVEGAQPLVGQALEDTLTDLTNNRWVGGQFEPGYNTVVNLATLLQTLDTDGNPDNGIEIAGEVAALFADESIDFHQHWFDFINELGFRKVLGDAKSKGLLDSARQVRKPWRAMEHLYANLGMDSKLRALSAFSNNGPISTSRTEYKFDSEGKRTRQESDWTGDGSVNEITAYTYDANGNQSTYDWDQNADGVRESYAIYSYDPEGNLTRKESHNDEDGNPERLETYIYDAYGNETRFEKYEDGRLTAFSFIDYDAQGRPLNIENTAGSFTWTYTSDGSEIFRDVLPGEFRSSSLGTWSYDSDDNLIRKDYDYDRDGTLDVILLYTNNAAGKQTLYEADADADGSIDSTHSTAYDAQGRLIREAWDYENDGKPDRIQKYTYDEQGNETSYTDDTDGDGSPDAARTAKFEYDSNGNITRHEASFDGDGPADRIYTYTYDASGKRTRVEADLDGDGAIDKIIVNSYNANDLLILEETDSNADGAVDSTRSWEYDKNTSGWWQVMANILGY